MNKTFRMPQRQARVDPENLSLAVQTQYAKGMLDMRPEDAIGVALSFLLMSAHREPHRTMLRKCLSEKIVREGFTGESMIALLNRVAK